MATKSDALNAFPRNIKLNDGREATVRLMEAADRNRIVEFAKALPEDDLLFLRTDITDPAVVDEWIGAIKSGHTVSLLAEVDDKVAAYASVHMMPARWTRRVGEIRVNVAPRLRGSGLGRRLISDIFEVAQALGLKKISAQMTLDQNAARKAFERLGFQVEAVLADWVEDRHGQPRDLLVMAHDVSGFHDQVVAR